MVNEKLAENTLVISITVDRVEDTCISAERSPGRGSSFELDVAGAFL
jgi:hypothetical protein